MMSMEEEEVSDRGLRSRVYQELCEHLGEVYTERLCSVFGGRRIYISNVSSNSVVRYFGRDVGDRLLEAFGRGYMYIPMAGLRRSRKVIDEEIVEALTGGLSTNSIVDRLGVSKRRVEVVRVRYGLRGKAGNPGYSRRDVLR